MWQYNYSDSLAHKGTKGMKWGYNDGERNGKRTAGEDDPALKIVAENKKALDAYSDMIEDIADVITPEWLKKIWNTPIYQLLKKD